VEIADVRDFYFLFAHQDLLFDIASAFFTNG
jgi:hypothetical protein